MSSVNLTATRKATAGSPGPFWYSPELEMRGNLFSILDINQAFTTPYHINGTIKANENYRRPQLDELHGLCQVIGSHRMQHQSVIDFKRRQLDLFANHIDIHTQTPIQLNCIRVQRRPSHRRHHANPKPGRSVEQVHACINDVAATPMFTAAHPYLIAIRAFDSHNRGDEITGIINQMAA